MNQDNRQVLWANEDHPSTELLRQYQQDTLPPALSHQLEEHLLDCELCTDVVEGMVLSSAPKTKAAVRHINRLVASKVRKKEKRRAMPLYMQDWRVAAAILLVMCSMVLVLYYNYREVTSASENIASDTDKAIQESLDLSGTPALTPPQTMAEAVPDTLRPAIAAAASTAKRAVKIPVIIQQEPRIAKPSPDVLADKAVEAEVEGAETAAKPAEAGSPVFAEKPQIISLQKNMLAPESTSVTSPVEGKLEGLKIRGMSSLAMNQLHGQVLSTTGQPLPGVAVTIKGTNTGVATDAKGNFTLNIPEKEATLVFNFIGFNRAEKAVSADTKDLTVNLSENTQALSEVVVVNAVGISEKKEPVVVAATPAAGKRTYKKYLQDSIRYTSDSRKGRVVIKATVSPTGALQNVKVSKSLCPSCDNEAVRLVKAGPAWKAATKDDVPVEQEIKIIVRFNPSEQE